MGLSVPFIIADVGSTWCRGASTKENLSLALKSIKIASGSRVSAVKFQLYTHKDLYGYEKEDMYSLPKEWIPELKKEAEKNGVSFMCSVFNKNDVWYLNDYVQIHKVASSDMKNVELIEEIAKTGKPIIVSTGASHYLESQWLINLWKEMSNSDICILDCVGAYPADTSDYHLNFIGELYEHIGAVGISDHTLSNSVALAAIGYGATVFEKHFDAFKGGGYGEVPDSCVAISPQEMTNYVDEIKTTFSSTERIYRRPMPSEKEFLTMHRRRVIALKELRPGDKLILDENYGAYRTKEADFRGAPMEKVRDFNGLRVKNNILAFKGISWDDIEKEEHRK